MAKIVLLAAGLIVLYIVYTQSGRGRPDQFSPFFPYLYIMPTKKKTAKRKSKYDEVFKIDGKLSDAIRKVSSGTPKKKGKKKL